MWVLTVGVLDFALEHTLIVPALPLLQAEHDASPGEVAWVITGFLLALAVATPLAGRLGDAYGRRRLLLVSLGLFALGSLISAVAESIGVVIAGRVVQGLGAGAGPLALAIARDVVGADRAPRAVGLIVGAGGIGGVLGTLSAGWLAELGVSAIFWALCAIAALLLVAVAAVVPATPGHRGGSVDWLGALLLAGVLAATMLAISMGNDWGWASGRVLALAGVAAAGLVAFVLRERRVAEPLVDLRLITQPALLAANLATFAIGFSLFIAYVLIPLLAGLPAETGVGLGLSTLAIGLLMLPGGIANMVGGPAGGRLVTRIGARAQARLGIALAAAGYLLLVAFDDTQTLMTVALIPLGLGVGLVICALVSVVVAAAPTADLATALGVNGVVRAIGGALGAGVAVAILTAHEGPAPGIPPSAGFDDGFAFGLGAVVVAFAIAGLVPGRGRDPVVAVESAPA